MSDFVGGNSWLSSKSVDLYAGGLPDLIKEIDLRNRFERFGPVQAVKIVRKDGKTFGFLTMKLENAQTAIKVLDENPMIINGNLIRVKWSFRQDNQPKTWTASESWQCADPSCLQVNQSWQGLCKNCGLNRNNIKLSPQRISSPSQGVPPDCSNGPKGRGRRFRHKREMPQMQMSVSSKVNIDLEDEMSQIQQLRIDLDREAKFTSETTESSKLTQEVIEMLKPAVLLCREQDEQGEKYALVCKGHEFYRQCESVGNARGILNMTHMALEGAAQVLADSIRRFLKSVKMEEMMETKKALEEFESKMLAQDGDLERVEKEEPNYVDLDVIVQDNQGEKSEEMMNLLVKAFETHLSILKAPPNKKNVEAVQDLKLSEIAQQTRIALGNQLAICKRNSEFPGLKKCYANLLWCQCQIDLFVGRYKEMKRLLVELEAKHQSVKSQEKNQNIREKKNLVEFKPKKDDENKSQSTDENDNLSDVLEFTDSDEEDAFQP